MKTKADKLKLIKAAMGEIPCDKTIVNFRHVNVFTGEILKAEVDIYKGYVISVRTGNEPSLQKAKEIIDGEGLYMIPGYVDTHMHIESTMLLPENFARVSIPWGTTCINHDPHEIGNVLGIDGIRFMIDNGKKTPQRQYAMASSCVPAAVGLENAVWVAMDYIDVMVHVFVPDMREYYSIETLWNDAKITEIPDID